MAEHYQNHGLSGEYVMLPTGEVVPAAEAAKVKPAAPAKAVTESTDKAGDK